MEAFNNDPKKKEFYVNRMKEHAKADEIIQGTGWENGKGCFIGCTLHKYDHEAFETEGIGPKWLGKLADLIFEGLPNDKAKQFACNFYPSMKVGLDLEVVKKEFLIFILGENIKYLDSCEYDKEAWPQVTESIEQTKRAIELCIKYQKGAKPEELAWSAAELAWSAAESAESAKLATRSARPARLAAWSARSAARSAAWSAKLAAEPAGSVAMSAAGSAESAARSAMSAAAEPAGSAAESAARSAAESAAYEKYADKLLDLLRG